jgi:preprotein translocase subunit Sss1
MAILQTLLGLGSLGIIGFVIYWVGIVLGVAPKAEDEAINKDPKI